MASPSPRQGQSSQEQDKKGHVPLHQEGIKPKENNNKTRNKKQSTESSSSSPSLFVSIMPVVFAISVSFYAWHYAGDNSTVEEVPESPIGKEDSSWNRARKFWKSAEPIPQPQQVQERSDWWQPPLIGEFLWEWQGDTGVLHVTGWVLLVTALSFLYYMFYGGSSLQQTWNKTSSATSVSSTDATIPHDNTTSKQQQQQQKKSRSKPAHGNRKALIPARSSMRFSQWARELTLMDPRVQILHFFNQIAARGASEQLVDQCRIHESGICTNQCLEQIKFNRNKQASNQPKTEPPKRTKKRSLRHKLTHSRSFPFATTSHHIEESKTDNSNDEEEDDCHITSKEFSLLATCFNRSSVFTVWRPTSQEAIRKMMQGGAVGKGLDIKGKSAVRGKLSAFVPVVQIYEERHKRVLRLIPKDARMRLYFSSAAARRVAHSRLTEVLLEMQMGFERARKLVLQKEDSIHEMEDLHLNGAFRKSLSLAPAVVEEAEWELALERFYKWGMTRAHIDLVDDLIPTDRYGLEIPQRLFVEAYILRGTVHREPGSDLDTGRPSQPAFLDMNLESLRKHFDMNHDKDHNHHKKPKRTRSKQRHQHVVSTPAPPPPPTPVAFQYNDDPEMAMDPRELVMAYEEKGRVLPVVSDFDCFLVGTRRVEYTKPVPQEQVDMMKWCVDQIEQVLDGEAGVDCSTPFGVSPSWTKQWLEVLKRERLENNFKPHIPKFGYADPKSYAIMAHAVEHLQSNGCVRHGAECFNYYFPQELDEEFLVISNDAQPNNNNIRWAKKSAPELAQYLSQKIDEGFMFPLNPKWILCDPGWKRLYDKQMRSRNPNVLQSLHAWYPPTSGIRERLEEVHAKHPHGFHQAPSPDPRAAGRKQATRMSMANGEAVGTDDRMSMAMALMEVDRVDKLRKAKIAFKAVLAANRFAKGANKGGGLLGLAPVVPVKTSSLGKGTLHRVKSRRHEQDSNASPNTTPIQPESPTKARPMRSKSTAGFQNVDTPLEPRKSMPARSQSYSLSKAKASEPISLPPLPPTTRKSNFKPSIPPAEASTALRAKRTAAMSRIDRRQYTPSVSPAPPSVRSRRGSFSSSKKSLIASLQSKTTKRHKSLDLKGLRGSSSSTS